jgi:hypothetical protein
MSQSALTPELVSHYRVYRRRLEDFLHLSMIWSGIAEGQWVPKNDMGHGKAEFAATLRTVVLGWLATFVDPRDDSLNVFTLWLELFPSRATEIEAVRKEVNPLLGKLKAFRDKVAFHADRRERVHDSVRLALFDPRLATLQDRFLRLAVDLLNDEHQVPGLAEAVSEETA